MPAPNYVMFHKPDYDPYEGAGPFELAISRHNDYSSFRLTRKETDELLAEIQATLELQSGRPMDWGDLGLTNPDDLPF